MIALCSNNFFDLDNLKLENNYFDMKVLIIGNFNILFIYLFLFIFIKFN